MTEIGDMVCWSCTNWFLAPYYKIISFGLTLDLHSLERINSEFIGPGSRSIWISARAPTILTCENIYYCSDISPELLEKLHARVMLSRICRGHLIKFLSAGVPIWHRKVQRPDQLADQIIVYIKDPS